MLSSLFDNQLKNLIQKNYHNLLGLSENQFTEQLVPLKQKLEGQLLPDINIDQGALPFVIVINLKNIPTEKAMEIVIKEGKKGTVNTFPIEPKKFTPIESVTIPDTLAYLLTDIDRGKETLNVTPNEALQTITQKNRSPLTIDEGIALITHYPEFLIKNNCYSLLASRCGDQRVPAIWISEKRPKLGWCWAGNPHTWLGSASCKQRIS